MTANNLSIHNILCPTDFSDFSASAFEESVRLARWFGATVTVAHVMYLPVPVSAAGFVPMAPELDADARKATLEQLTRFVEATEHTGVTVRTLLREGDPCHEIHELALEIGADLVVMGTHGYSGFKKLVLGSITEALLNHPPAPVLTVHRGLQRKKGLYRTVLCATDISDWSAGTVGVALTLADEGAKRLMVVNVIEQRLGTSGGEIARTAVAALHALIPDEHRRSYPIEERIEYGETDREILRVAEREGTDLIVMGTRGGGALGHLFGSTVRRVVRDATCPVLVVPAGHVWRATGLLKQEPQHA